MKKYNPFFAALVAFGFIFSTCALAETPAKDQKDTAHKSSKSQPVTQHPVKKVATKTATQHTIKSATSTKGMPTKNAVSKKASVNSKTQTTQKNSAKPLTTKHIATNKNAVKSKSAGTQTSAHHLTKNHNKKKVIKQKQTSTT